MLTFSNSPMWVKCALTPSLSNPTAASGDGPFVPDTDDQDDVSEARLEGRAAHWVGQGVLQGDASSTADFAGEAAPNGWIVTPDMVVHVQGYVDYMRSLGEIVRVEQLVSIPQLFIRGRVDANAADSGPVLHVVELKYGWEQIEVEWNAQLLCEAIALFDPDRHDTVTMTIYQPRGWHPDGPVRHWTLDERELTAAYQWLAGKAAAALAPSPLATPGRHCLRCKGNSRCAALAMNTGAIVDWITGTAIVEMNAVTLATEYRFLYAAADLIKARLSGVRAELEGRMKRGEYMPGYGWDIRRRDREFTVEPADIEEKTGINPWKDVLMSPAELEREGADPEIVKEITTRPDAGPKLIPVTRQTFERMFKGR